MWLLWTILTTPLTLAVVMISPIPDLIVSQSADIAMDVDSYFNEMIVEYTLLSPDFLAFSQRHLQAVDLVTAKAKANQRFVAVARSHRYVVLLEEGEGIAVYEIMDQFQPQLIQHYFSSQISHNFTHISLQNDLLAVYNSHELALVDLSNKQLPCLLSLTSFPFTLTKVLIRSEGELLLSTQSHGLFIYQFIDETGLIQQQEITSKFTTGQLDVVDMLEVGDRLFVLDRELGLMAAHTPWMNSLKVYGIKGEKLAQTEAAVIIDGKTMLHLGNDSFTSLQSPPFTATSLVSYKEMIYLSNGTHLSVLNANLNLSAFEVREVKDLDMFNNNLLVVEDSQFLIRNYIPGSSTLFGTAPDTTGEFRVHFKARAKDGEVEASFSVIVESPPLEILLVLLAASTLALLFIVGCSLVLRKVIGLTPRPERHELNEERRSTDQLRAESFGGAVGEVVPVPPQP